MGKGKRLFFASLLGFNQQQTPTGRQPQVEAAQRPPQERYYQQYQGMRVRPRNDYEGNYCDRHGYADRDIDKKATEFIERVRRGMLNDQDQ